MTLYASPPTPNAAPTGLAASDLPTLPTKLSMLKGDAAAVGVVAAEVAPVAVPTLAALGAPATTDSGVSPAPDAPPEGVAPKARLSSAVGDPDSAAVGSAPTTGETPAGAEAVVAPAAVGGAAPVGATCGGASPSSLAG